MHIWSLLCFGGALGISPPIDGVGRPGPGRLCVFSPTVTFLVSFLCLFSVLFSGARKKTDRHSSTRRERRQPPEGPRKPNNNNKQTKNVIFVNKIVPNKKTKSTAEQSRIALFALIVCIVCKYFAIYGNRWRYVVNIWKIRRPL